jgi:hypothetical protein
MRRVLVSKVVPSRFVLAGQLWPPPCSGKRNKPVEWRGNCGRIRRQTSCARDGWLQRGGEPKMTWRGEVRSGRVRRESRESNCSANYAVLPTRRKIMSGTAGGMERRSGATPAPIFSFGGGGKGWSGESGAASVDVWRVCSTRPQMGYLISENPIQIRSR